MHGPSCKATAEGLDCRVGCRTSHVCLLSGSVVRIWQALQDTLTAASRSGTRSSERLLRLVRARLPNGERIVAVNRKSDESGIEVVTEDGLKDLLGDTSYSLFSNDNTEDDFVKEAWRAFLVAVLLFLIAEALLCLQPKPGQTPIKGSPEPSPAS